MTVINTNSAALRAQNSSRVANNQLQTAMERLSSGKRINSAKDDAAGLAIATNMTAQVRGMNQGIRNANDGISLAQTADGALGEVSNMLQRMRELAVQSSSGTYDDKDRAKMQTEVNELKRQIVDTMGTKFNGVALFDAGADKTVSIQTGAGATDQVALKITKLNLSPATGTVAAAEVTKGLSSALLAGDPKVGTSHKISAEDVAYEATIGGSAVTAADIGTTRTLAADDEIYQEAAAAGSISGGMTVATAAQATAALEVLDTALDAVSSTRASIGAGQSRLESAVNSLTTNVTNLSDAKSRIEDTDFSVETTALAKAQILSQASTAMLSQANQSQQGVMSLLR